MSEENTLQQVLQSYFEANAVFAPLVSGIQLLGLLRISLSTGLLNAARTPASLAQLAAMTGLDETRITDLCLALVAHSVFIQENELYRLTDAWATLTGPDALFSFQTLLDDAFVKAKVLQISDTQDYWALTSDERLTFAKGVTLDPASRHSAAVFQWMMQNVPEMVAPLEAGGHYLELGCGIGGGLLSMLQAYPKVTAVAVEIASDVLEEARRAAVALGVSDRVSFWLGNAGDFNEQARFDFAWWSQFFFPSETRAAALETARKALKPGGVLFAPVQDDPAVVDGQLMTDVGRSYTLNRLVYGAWGVPALGAQALQQEFETAGFTDVKTVATPLSIMVVGRRSLVEA